MTSVVRVRIMHICKVKIWATLLITYLFSFFKNQSSETAQVLHNLLPLNFKV